MIPPFNSSDTKGRLFKDFDERSLIKNSTFKRLTDIRSFRPKVGLPDSSSPKFLSSEAYLSFFKPEKREWAWKDSDCTCGIQG